MLEFLLPQHHFIEIYTLNIERGEKTCRVSDLGQIFYSSLSCHFFIIVRNYLNPIYFFKQFYFPGFQLLLLKEANKMTLATRRWFDDWDNQVIFKKNVLIKTRPRFLFQVSLPF